ncbi:peptidyl-prolyl cis-trans isomerase [Alicyclobacillus contaminans]|uniref:peptidylprolyl isomerase n=1 Tax=Alicyclobacillus contaminans TaxID=392016 RepID=UPI000400D9DC|nr:peptidylprolyl isomerase [Alicyclobacillus contaminans]GMA51991.1 peptidyl-prolyl cis-trans isomerase [Alicyclobacillus contaminans]
MRKQYAQPPAMQLQEGIAYEAVVHTNKGDFTIELLSQQAPRTVNNFVFLAKEGYFDGVVFHRIIREFMIQTGDPTGTGMGGPGYRFADELPPALPYEPGVVAMANAGPDTNGSQFFICTGNQCQHLNQYPNYTVFGRVKSGMDTVRQIAATPVTRSASGEVSRPTEEVRMESVEIVERAV